MCGIAGFLLPTARSHDALRGALKTLACRGPDDARVKLFDQCNGLWETTTHGPLGLLHTRLSIRDLSSRASQPMCNEDGTIWLVYNGEIYGWEPQREELIDQGHRFVSATDSEFILHGYEAWGESVLDHLRGMFAFALLDLRRGRFFCARDRLGKKPFYYSGLGNGFVFGSTLRTIARLLPAETLQIDRDALDAYLTHRYIPAPRSLFREVFKLPAGHKVCWDFRQGSRDAVISHPYWQPQPDVASDPLRMLEESVKLRLVSDRPVGLFLSGGVDSHAIARALVRTSGAERVESFTAKFSDDSDFDESEDATKTATSLGLRHKIFPIQMDSAEVEQIVEDFDEPFADPSAVPTWYLCREATKAVKVALTGDGGDELFAGYKRYGKHLRSAWWRRRHRPSQSEGFDSTRLLPKKGTLNKVRRLLLEASLSWQEAYVLRFSGMDPLMRAYLQPSVRVTQAHYWRLPAQPLSPLEWMLECDRLNYLPDYILKKGDLCSMAHGLELRNPLLDHRLVETILGLPPSIRFTTPSKRWLRHYISDATLSAAKRGFNPPLSAWLRQEGSAARIRQLPKSLDRITHGQLDEQRLGSLLTSYFRGEISSEIIWQLLVLDISLNSFRK